MNHRARVRGNSKYGISRTVRVMLDLLTVKFLVSYFGRPMRLFGSLGFVSTALGGVILLCLLTEKILLGQPLASRPLLLLGALLLVVGVQLLSLGILGELIIRVYHEGGRRRSYLIRRPGADGPVLPLPVAMAAATPAPQVGDGVTWPTVEVPPLAARAAADRKRS